MIGDVIATEWSERIIVEKVNKKEIKHVAIIRVVKSYRLFLLVIFLTLICLITNVL